MVSEIANNELDIGLATPAPEVLLTPNIGVFGVGGAGGNAINNMIRSKLGGVSFFAANTDAQALSRSLVADKIQLGVALTKGLGAGANPEIGKAAAEESADKIKEALTGLHLLFLTAGMGGGTGTGAAPVVARLAKEMNILTVGVVSKPFNFEGARRMKTAEQGIIELQKYVDTLVVIPNQNLYRIAGEGMTFLEGFKIADNVLCQGVRSITDLILKPGIINLDFADVRTVLSTMGRSMMGTGEANGENRALVAAEQAITNPLLDNTSIKGAKSLLLNISSGSDMTMNEFDIAAERIRAEVDPDANIIVGASVDEDLSGKIRVSLVATGIDDMVNNIPEAVNKPVVPEPAPVNVTPPEIAPIVAPTPAPEPVAAEPDLMPIQPSIAQTPELILTETVEPLSATLVVDLPTPPPAPEPALFTEQQPIMADITPITDMPEERAEIKVDTPQNTANVKPQNSGLFGRFWGKKRPVVRPAQPKEDEPLLDVFGNDMSLPSFFKEPRK